jgi:hypothetical protein
MRNILVVLLVVIFLIPQIYANEPEITLIREKNLNSTFSTIALSPSGKYIAVGHFDGTLMVLNDKPESNE